MKKATSQYLADRFKEVTLDGKLIAFTNIQEQIKDLTLEQATYKVEDLNTLAALTFHLNYYIDGVLQVFKGGDLTIRDKFSFDMEPLKTDKDWEDLKFEFLKNSKSFYGHLLQMSEEKLKGDFVKEEYGSYHKNIDAMIEHCYYHFGQMVIIKKVVLKSLS